MLHRKFTRTYRINAYFEDPCIERNKKLVIAVSTKIIKERSLNPPLKELIKKIRLLQITLYCSGTLVK